MSPPTDAPQPTRHYSMFAPWVIWFSKNLWRDVARRWTGICLIYLFLLELITWMPLMVKGYYSFANALQTDLPPIVDQVPNLKITNGVVSIDKPEPYTIIDPQTRKALVIIDTTGQTTEPPSPAPSLLVTRNSVVQRKDAFQLQTTDLSGVSSFQMDSKRVYGWLDTAKRLFLPVGAPLMIVFGTIGRLIQALIYGLIGLAIASSVGARLTFGALMRLSIVAITPVIIIDTVMGLLGINGMCIWTWIGIGIEIAILIFAIRANAPVPRTPPGPSYGLQGFTPTTPP